jgi:hypothetical protein
VIVREATASPDSSSLVGVASSLRLVYTQAKCTRLAAVISWKGLCPAVASHSDRDALRAFAAPVFCSPLPLASPLTFEPRQCTRSTAYQPSLPSCSRFKKMGVLCTHPPGSGPMFHGSRSLYSRGSTEIVSALISRCVNLGLFYFLQAVRRRVVACSDASLLALCKTPRYALTRKWLGIFSLQCEIFDHLPYRTVMRPSFIDTERRGRCNSALLNGTKDRFVLLSS